MTTDVKFRFTELSAPTTNMSTHILIDGLVPVEAGSARLTSNYRGIDIATGTEYDTGQVLLELPSPPSGDGASSPIVGIVSRAGGWDGYTTTPASPTTVGESVGSFTFDNEALTIALNVNQGATNLTGSTTFTIVDDYTIDVAAFTMTDGSSTYAFGATQLVYGNDEYYGVIVSEDSGVDYDSLMFALRLKSPDGDDDGMPLLVDRDGEGKCLTLPTDGSGIVVPTFGTLFGLESTLGPDWGFCSRYGYVWVGRYCDTGYIWIPGNRPGLPTAGWYYYWGKGGVVHYLWSPALASSGGGLNAGWIGMTEDSKGFFYTYLHPTYAFGHFKTGDLWTR